MTHYTKQAAGGGALQMRPLRREEGSRDYRLRLFAGVESCIRQGAPRRLPHRKPGGGPVAALRLPMNQPAKLGDDGTDHRGLSVELFAGGRTLFRAGSGLLGRVLNLQNRL